MSVRAAGFAATVFLGVGALAVLAGQAPARRSSTIPASCAVTLPGAAPFTPPPPYPARPPFAHRGWFGSQQLWTTIPEDGLWAGLHVPTGYRNKVFWWHPGYDGPAEPRPAFTLTARRLDGDAPPLTETVATNAHHPDFGGWTMLVMPDIPERGCWQVTGSYQGTSVSYVVWVGEA